eukprot:gene42435-57450_t
MWDLETTQLRNSPGRRLFLQDGEFFASDLGKWWTGKKFRQPPGAQVKFPKDKWVQVKIHLVLSEGNDGRMQVWQDGQKVLDATGKTLPRASTIYDRMQVGVTANGRPNRAQTIYVDDVAEIVRNGIATSALGLSAKKGRACWLARKAVDQGIVSARPLTSSPTTDPAGPDR